jgi:hypothetical protein
MAGRFGIDGTIVMLMGVRALPACLPACLPANGETRVFALASQPVAANERLHSIGKFLRVHSESLFGGCRTGCAPGLGQDPAGLEARDGAE